MKKRQLSAFALTALLAGCVAPPNDAPITTNLNAQEMSHISATGTASISGQAFMRQRGGGVVTAAGEQILLLPATSYTREVTDRMLAGEPQTAAGSSIKPYTRTTIADADGRFTFSNLASGAYLVLAVVRWEAPTRHGLAAQGGGLKQEVSVGNGEKASIIMTR